MDRYAARINLIGTTQRERYINRIKNDVVNKLPDNPSYKEVVLNGETTFIDINNGTSNTNKQFAGLPGAIIRLGDYIDWNGRKYLVTSLNTDDEIYSSGTMHICTYVLHWQRKDGTIVSRWAVAQDFTKYDSGQSSNGAITVASNQYGLIVPIDDDTRVMPRDKRFVMDIVTGEDVKNGAIPDTYLLTNEKPVLSDYTYFDRGGTITFTTKFDSFNPSSDKWVDCGDGYGWICDYINPDEFEPPVSNVTATIVGNDVIYGGRKRTWTVEFRDEDNNIINENDINFSWAWNVESDFDVDVLIDGLKIQLITDKTNIGKAFNLQIYTSDIIAQKTIDIIALG